jgi:hypothetical protein
MSYPHVIVPKPYQEAGVKKGEPRFQMDMIFDPADLKKFRAEDGAGHLVEVDIKQLAVQTAREQFSELVDTDKFKAAFLKADGSPGKGWPFRDGTAFVADQNSKRQTKGKKDIDKSISEAFNGKVIVSAKSYENVKPILSYYDATEKKTKQLSRISDVDMSKAKELFVGGNYAGAELSLRCSQVSGTYYLSFYLNAVRFLSEGEKFGQGNGMMDRFDGVYGGESDHNPTEGMSDEIPF